MCYKTVQLPEFPDVKAWINRQLRTIYINTAAREGANIYQIVR